MKMTLRWFGSRQDSVTLEQIRQIPGVTGVISCLYDIPVGVAWSYEEICKLKQEVEAAGLELTGIESINVHEDIKLGTPDRDYLIENYKQSLENVGKAGIHLVCYNFMTVFDWTRTNLSYPLPDGSTTMAYEGEKIEGIAPGDMFEHMKKNSQGFEMPGWEMNREAELRTLFERYKGMTKEKLKENYRYFLNAIMPVCDQYGIKMAMHPDDPAWSIFGLTRVATCEEDLLEIAALHPSRNHGFTLCTGSLGSNPKNDLVKIIRNPKIAERIHFAHIRNMKHLENGNFYECGHVSKEGSFDMYEIVKALTDMGFDGVVRPDHGRMIWGEKARPGYGLYDRALGATYLCGLFEAIQKMRSEMRNED